MTRQTTFDHDVEQWRAARRHDAEMAFITLPYEPPEIPEGLRYPEPPPERDEPEPWVPE